ncbi:DUF2497 domain-containing protein [Oricola indica]|uniref:DUF2497 domain-containing protein n=1 Tax=Oricola indica TaxID=2872591 RepID=UPI001CBC2405|nr:DUF2497 domain-containing protein [Oricola indica]
MSQSSALREQPSMDEILASIRKIIDAGETQSRPPEEPKVEAVAPKPADPIVTVPPAPANDAEAVRPRAPQAMSPQQPRTPLSQVREEPRTDAPKLNTPKLDVPKPAAEVPVKSPDQVRSPEDDIAAAVTAYLAQEIEASKPARSDEAVTPEAVDDVTAFPETVQDDDTVRTPAESAATPDISEAEAELTVEFSEIDRDLLAERRAKYDSRFTEADDGAFREVGNLLRGTVEAETPHPSAVGRTSALVSDAVSQTVSQSLSSLSGITQRRDIPDLDAMAEDMLRPMLQEWLDNNLPSLVERLVRAEIERIARGEPRTA